MMVLIIRHRRHLGVYDADGKHLMTLPQDHLVSVKLGRDMRGKFDAEWKGSSLEIGDRKP